MTQRHKKLITSLLLIVILVVLTGCGNRPSDNENEWKDPAKPDSTIETISDWKDPGQEWKDPNKPTDPGAALVTVEVTETDPAGGYRHQIDDFVFYTERNVDDYIRVENGQYIFDALKMAEDVFGETGGVLAEGAVYLHAERSIAQIKLIYGLFDDDDERSYSGAWVGFELVYYGHAMVVKCPRVDGERLYLVSDRYRYTNYEIAELSLYMCENISSWRQYDFWYSVWSHLPERYYAWDMRGRPPE